MIYATPELAKAAIKEKIDAVYDLLNGAEEIAEANNVGFRFDGPSYGMGGSYSPKDKFEPEDWDIDHDPDVGGWYASSQSC